MFYFFPTQFFFSDSDISMWWEIFRKLNFWSASPPTRPHGVMDHEQNPILDIELKPKMDIELKPTRDIQPCKAKKSVTRIKLDCLIVQGDEEDDDDDDDNDAINNIRINI